VAAHHHCHGLDVVGDDRVRILADAAYDGWDVQIVCIAMKLITEIMIWYLFIRVCISDFNEYANRKIRKTFNLE
jgi:hypothetical protein